MSEPRELPESTGQAAPPPNRDLLFLLPAFLREQSSLLSLRMMALTLLSGLTNGLMIAFVLSAVRTKSKSQDSFALVVLFLVSMGLFILSRVYVQDWTSIELESISRRVRLRIADRIRRAELLDFERVGASAYYNVVTNELKTIVVSAKQFVGAIASAWLAVAGVLYITYLSVGAAIATVITLGVGVIQFQRSNRKYEELLRHTEVHENTFLDRLRDLRDGFKELKTSARKNDDLFERYLVPGALRAEESKLETSKVMNRNAIYGQTFVYVLLGSVVFVMPHFIDMESKQAQIVATLIFILSPVAEMIGALEASVRAGGAILAIRRLEADLQTLTPIPREPQDAAATFGPFQKLELRGARFSYGRDGAWTFGLKPINLTLKRGDIIFIVGGNGSGKSTFIHMLCGLFIPQSGEIRVNGKRVDINLVTAYRSHFGIILQDYHLFDRLYGHVEPDLDLADSLLRELDLAGKTSIRPDGTVSTLELSGGQKKRLAMIMARLDDTPIYIFDEWAADQDPHYKEYFYRQLLPRLSAAGKTVIVVSHDERYFPSSGSNVYEMVEGELLPYVPRGGGGPDQPLLPPGQP